MSKRPGGFADLLAKKAKTDRQTNAENAAQVSNPASTNRYLSSPVPPEGALATFLVQARNAARRFLPKETTTYPVTNPFCEIEARLGILKLPFGTRDRRVTSSGPKMQNGKTVKAFHVHQQPPCVMESGVSRTHFLTWTQGGLVSFLVETGLTQTASLHFLVQDSSNQMRLFVFFCYRANQGP